MSCRLRLMLRPFARASRGIPAIDSETLYSARPELAHRGPAVTGAAHYPGWDSGRPDWDFRQDRRGVWWCGGSFAPPRQ